MCYLNNFSDSVPQNIDTGRKPLEEYVDFSAMINKFTIFNLLKN